MTDFWTGKKVVVTGGRGFVGSHLVDLLVEAGASVTVMDTGVRGKNHNPYAHYPDARQSDVTGQGNCYAQFKGTDAVFNLAGAVGGLYYNIAHQAEQFWGNMQLLVPPALAAAQANVPVYMQTSTVCIAKGTKIPCPSGYLPIEEIQPGMTVLTERGFQPVQYVHENGLRQVWEIVLEDGRELELTGDHLVRCSEDGALIWREANTIEEGDYVISVSGRMCTEISLGEFAWMLGFWTGDGSYNITKEGALRQICFTNKDRSLLRRAQRATFERWGKKNKIQKKERAYNLAICSQAIAQEFMHLGLSRYAEDKDVPEIIWRASTEDQALFLQGLFDADGTIGKTTGQISLCSSSAYLCRDVAMLLSGMGIRTILTERTIPRPNRPDLNFNGQGEAEIYYLYVSGGDSRKFLDRVGFSSRHKRQIGQSVSEGYGRPYPIAQLVCETYAAIPRGLGKSNGSFLRQYHEGNEGIKCIGENNLYRFIDELPIDPPSELTFFARDSIDICRVSSVRQRGLRYVYDLTVPETSTFVANGLLVHNCIYGRGLNDPAREQWGRLGEPEAGNAGYAWAKRMGERICGWAFEGASTRYVVVRPSNIYGCRDYFDETAHVIPALIRKFTSGADPVRVFGGSQQREFLYVEDAARGMLHVAQHGRHKEAYNLGTDGETQVSIAELAEMIGEATDYKGDVDYVENANTGDPSRSTDCRKVHELGWVHQVGLWDGLVRTVAWYRER